MYMLKSSGHGYYTCDPVNYCPWEQTNINSITWKGQREGNSLHCLDKTIGNYFQATICYSFEG